MKKISFYTFLFCFKTFFCLTIFQPERRTIKQAGRGAAEKATEAATEAANKAASEAIDKATEAANKAEDEAKKAVGGAAEEAGVVDGVKNKLEDVLPETG